ncbi:helix-turn-helix domain-containing protein [Streptomyces sp. SID685]|nr:helix-turn-helix domain-containing protein [Streptomyces sp. SID685]
MDNPGGARCAARLTQMQVGKACGYSASAVSRIESGRLRVDYPTLMRFASSCGSHPSSCVRWPCPAWPMSLRWPEVAGRWRRTRCFVGSC